MGAGMRNIEQVFIPVSRIQPQSERANSAACSPGVLPIDLAEMLGWAKDLVLPIDGRFDLLNLFFHHLPSGAYAIGRLIPAETPSGARAKSFWLHNLVVPAETLLRFGNNPAALYQDILGNGLLPFVTKPGDEVKPIELNRPRKWFDIPLLKGMSLYPGAYPIAKLADVVLHSLSVAVSGGQQPLYVISALFNLFPIRFRPELTFSSGVYFAPSRHFRLIGISGRSSGAGIRDFFPVPFIDLDELAIHSESEEPRHGWGRFLLDILKNGRYDILQSRLINYDRDYARKLKTDVPFAPSDSELDALGAGWLKNLNKAESPVSETPAEKAPKPRGKSSDKKRVFRLKRTDIPDQPPINISEKLRRWLLSDNPEDGVAYFRDAKPARPRLQSPLILRSAKTPLFSPFQRLCAAWPEEEKNLERLDRLVTAVLNGDDAETLDRLTRFWSDFVGRVDEDRKWQICEEYTHFIQLCLTEGETVCEAGSAQQGIAALDLLNLFLNDGETAEISLDAD